MSGSFLSHPSRETYLEMNATPDLQAGHYLIYLVQFENGFQRTELMGVHASNNGGLSFHREIAIPPGFQLNGKRRKGGVRNGNRKREPTDIPESMGEYLEEDQNALQMYPELASLLRKSDALLRQEVGKIAEELKEQLHPVFKKEEYKLEISFGKKLRLLGREERHRKDEIQSKPRARAKGPTYQSGKSDFKSQAGDGNPDGRDSTTVQYEVADPSPSSIQAELSAPEKTCRIETNTNNGYS